MRNWRGIQRDFFLGCGFGRRDLGGRLQGEGRVDDSDVGEGKSGLQKGGKKVDVERNRGVSGMRMGRREISSRMEERWRSG